MDSENSTASSVKLLSPAVSVCAVLHSKLHSNAKSEVESLRNQTIKQYNLGTFKLLDSASFELLGDLESGSCF
ncbi:hypothetical protein EON64_08470 [archaeon]|nr:MAG: hypothetical protein EON64_08470 [archaeon]